MIRLLKISALLILIFGVFAYGVWVGVNKRQPYRFARALYRDFSARFIGAPDDPRYVKIKPFYRETSVDSLIQITTPSDLDERRSALVDFVWRGQGFPEQRTFDTVETSIDDQRYDDVESMTSIDRCELTMPYGVNSIAYHFRAVEPNGSLALYHQGHLGDFVLGKPVIAALLDAGFDVMAFAMPLLGMNNRPVVALERFGKVRLSGHRQLSLLDGPEHCSMRYFLEPPIAGINYGLEKFGYDAVHIVGMSGGGWTAIACAALDPRIRHSYPVAHSSYPMYLREITGDYEQLLADFYRICNYPELFVMGAAGEGRSQLQILNKYDTSCCWGIRYQLYEGAVRDRVSALARGGSFAVFEDDTHRKHKLSPVAVDRIISDLTAITN